MVGCQVTGCHYFLSFMQLFQTEKSHEGWWQKSYDVCGACEILALKQRLHVHYYSPNVWLGISSAYFRWIRNGMLWPHEIPH